MKKASLRRQYRIWFYLWEIKKKTAKVLSWGTDIYSEMIKKSKETRRTKFRLCVGEGRRLTEGLEGQSVHCMPLADGYLRGLTLHALGHCYSVFQYIFKI